MVYNIDSVKPFLFWRLLGLDCFLKDFESLMRGFLERFKLRELFFDVEDLLVDFDVDFSFGFFFGGFFWEIFGLRRRVTIVTLCIVKDGLSIDIIFFKSIFLNYF